MHHRNWKLTTILLAATYGWGAAQGQSIYCPITVHVTFFDHEVAPYFLGTGPDFPNQPGVLKGWIEEAVRATGCSSTLEFNRRPVKRAYLELSNGKTDILALGAETAPNRAMAAFPPSAGPRDSDPSWGIVRSDISLWVRRGETRMHWSGGTLDGPTGFKVGVPRGTAAEELAQLQHWPADVGTNAPATVQQLVLGRFPVALLPEAVVVSQSEETRAQIQRLEPAVQTTSYYSPASKSFYASYPEFVQRYWSALCTVARADKTVIQTRPLPACGKWRR